MNSQTLAAHTSPYSSFRNVGITETSRPTNGTLPSLVIGYTDRDRINHPIYGILTVIQLKLFNLVGNNWVPGAVFNQHNGDFIDLNFFWL